MIKALWTASLLAATLGSPAGAEEPGDLVVTTDDTITSGNTPTLSLEQDGSSGFTPQTWDVAGNEANFFIQDVTNGNRLVFRIRPNAPTDSIFIANSGNVGIGYAAPGAPLHVRRTDATEQLLRLESASGTTKDRAFMYLQNNGGIRFEFRNLNRANGWRFQAQTGGNDRFEITKVGSGEIEYDFRPNGNLIIAGNLFTNSDVNSKQDIEPVNSRALLQRLDALPVSEWSYKDAAEIRHLGPMAQDFHAQFGLGEGETSIAPMDLAGVSLAAVKAVRGEQQALQLNIAQQLEQKDRRIGELEARLELLETLILQHNRSEFMADQQ